MCQPGKGQWTSAARACGCGCGSFVRRFISKKEEKEMLEEYKDQLKKELVAVEERIKDFKGK